ncbi:MAG: TolC family protein [Bdellovibrionota bacterium]
MPFETLKRSTSRVLLLTLLVGTAARANPLSEFISSKIASNSEVLAASEVLKAAQANRDLAASTLYPKISANWNSTKSDTHEGFQNLLSLNAEQTLFGGGQEYTELQAARLGVSKAEYDLADAEDRAQARFALKLAQIVLDKERGEVLDKTKHAQEDRLTELKRRFRIGQSREPDLLQVEVERSRLDRKIADNVTAIEKDEQQIKSLLLLEDSEMQTLNTLINPQGVKLLYMSLAPRPEYRSASLKLSADALAQKEKSAWLTATPTLGLYGQQNLIRPSSSTNAWEWGLKAQWTFFDGFKTPAQVETARSQKVIAERALFAFDYDRKNNLVRLARESERSEAKKEAIDADIANATKALKQQEHDYRLRIVTEIEVQSTIQSILDLELELLDIQATRAQLHLQKFLGGEQVL